MWSNWPWDSAKRRSTTREEVSTTFPCDGSCRPSRPGPNAISKAQLGYRNIARRRFRRWIIVLAFVLCGRLYVRVTIEIGTGTQVASRVQNFCAMIQSTERLWLSGVDAERSVGLSRHLLASLRVFDGGAPPAGIRSELGTETKLGPWMGAATKGSLFGHWFSSARSCFRLIFTTALYHR